MIRLIPLPRPTSRCALGAALCYALGSALSFTGHAGQLRSVTEGVYSAGQAARGRQIYQAQCAECHGSAMEGATGPPLVGDEFPRELERASAGGFVDKIQKTMPFNLAGSLSRQQSTDLAADILQAGKFPAGQAELSDAMLAQIAFPTARTSLGALSAAATSDGASLPPPEGNLAELMRAIAFPNSNIIFNLQIKDPGTQPKKEAASSSFDYVEWGSTVYPGWLAVDQAAIALTETAALLLTPGRRCQNGGPSPWIALIGSSTLRHSRM